MQDHWSLRSAAAGVIADIGTKFRFALYHDLVFFFFRTLYNECANDCVPVYNCKAHPFS